jgi:hypothetical protein
MSYVINIILMFTDDVTICIKIDPGIHIACIRFCPLKSGAHHMCARINFHTYDLTSSVIIKNNV